MCGHLDGKREEEREREGLNSLEGGREGEREGEEKGLWGGGRERRKERGMGSSGPALKDCTACASGFCPGSVIIVL